MDVLKKALYNKLNFYKELKSMKDKNCTKKCKNKIIKKYSKKRYSKENRNRANKTFEILKQIDEYYGPYFW